jgi:geranylgeranylglycerol-phosphate geranylgeranyltransferase
VGRAVLPGWGAARFNQTVKRRIRPSPAVHPALRIVRAGNLAVSFVGTIVGGLVAHAAGVTGSAEFWALLALAAASTALVTAGGNVLNDLEDIEGDRVNHPGRPLVTGEISVHSARILAVGLFAAGIELALPVILVEPLVGLILAIALAAMLAYEFRLKAAGLGGNLIVAALTGLVFLYGGAAAGNVLVVVPFAAMAFLATASREVIKDMEDVEGDVERHTLPKNHGLPVAGAVARASVGAAIALSFVPLFWFVHLASVAGIIYLALVLAADAVFVVSVVTLPNRLHWEQSMSKLAMTIALFAFLAVAFR